VIHTEPVKITVRSLVDGDPLKAAPRGPVALPEQQGHGIWGWLLAVLFLVAAWLLRRRAAATGDLPRPEVSPREGALARLERSTEPARWLEILRGYRASGEESRISPGDRATLLILLRGFGCDPVCPGRSL